MRTPKKQVSFSWDNVLTINEKGYERGGGSEFRVGRWIVDGKRLPINIERREYYQTEDGKKYGKAKGLAYEDAKWIHDNWADLEGLMQGKGIREIQKIMAPAVESEF